MNSQINLWKSLLPDVKPYYAVKCNPEPVLLDWLKESGAGFDCASKREIDIVPEKSDILYANPCKASSDISYANEKGVHTTVVDSIEEIHKCADSQWNGDVLVRIRVEDSGSAMPFSSKFGVSPSLLSSLAKEAASRKLLLKGISFHVGSGCGNPTQYYDAIRTAYEGLKILKNNGHSVPKQMIDIGGGFVGEPFFTPAALQIRRAISQFNLSKNIDIVAEPGRFFASTSHDLFTRVIGKKPSASGNGWRYTIDESLYGQFSCIPYDKATPMWVPIRLSERKISSGTIFGRTCDSVDMIASSKRMEELDIGDWLWWPHMGAYTTVTATEFNGFPRPPVIVFNNDECQLPNPKDFNCIWPSEVQYVSPVTTPKLD